MISVKIFINLIYYLNFNSNNRFTIRRKRVRGVGRQIKLQAAGIPAESSVVINLYFQGHTF